MNHRNSVFFLMIIALCSPRESFAQNVEAALKSFESFLSSCNNVGQIDRAGSHFRVYQTDPASYLEFDLDDFDAPSDDDVKGSANTSVATISFSCTAGSCVRFFMGGSGEWNEMQPMDILVFNCSHNATHKMYLLLDYYYAPNKGD